MSRFGRRRFLASSAGIVAGAASASAVGGLPQEDAAALDGVFSQAGAPGVSRRLLHAAGLTVNGIVDPLGVDPDGLWFAWTLRAGGRSARQSGYRLAGR